MQKLMLVICMVLFANQSATAGHAKRPHGRHVHSHAPNHTPYLSNVRSIGAILRNNILSLLDSSQPRHSLLKGMLFAHRITKVAKLFAYARLIEEVQGDPEKYGPLHNSSGCKGGEATQTQLRARAAFLSKDMNIVFKSNIDEVRLFSKKAVKKIEAFTYRIQSILYERKPSNQGELQLKTIVTYLHLIEEDGYFDEKGPKYLHIHEKTGAEEEYYLFTWVTVTVAKLAEAIADDRFQLRSEVNKITNREEGSEPFVDPQDAADGSDSESISIPEGLGSTEDEESVTIPEGLESIDDEKEEDSTVDDEIEIPEDIDN